MYTEEMLQALTCLRELEEAGADQTAVVSAEGLPFDPCVRKICESNGCGNFGRNYGCPPSCGMYEECKAACEKYRYIFVFRNAYPLEDSFDFEGMAEAKEKFNELFYRVWDIAKAADPGCLVLGAGGCARCEVCAAKTGEPCRMPEKRSSSLEGYGMIVSRLAERCGMKYISGQNTVTYFGGVLFGNK